MLGLQRHEGGFPGVDNWSVLWKKSKSWGRQGRESTPDQETTLKKSVKLCPGTLDKGVDIKAISNL